MIVFVKYFRGWISTLFSRFPVLAGNFSGMVLAHPLKLINAHYFRDHVCLLSLKKSCQNSSGSETGLTTTTKVILKLFFSLILF